MDALHDKVCLITGAGSGIGAAIAQRFAREGAVVNVADINADGARAVAEGLQRSGAVSARPVTLDVTNAEAVELAIDRIVAEHGRIDVLVNNAGFATAPKPGQAERVASVYARRAAGEPAGSMSITVNLTDAEFHAIVAVHLFGTFNCTRAVLRHMEPRGRGAIVNVASVAGMIPYPVAPDLGAVKAALIGFTRSVGFEVSGAGIRVNCVAPGIVDTPPLQRALGARERASQKIGVGRPGEPDEVAAAVLWLASDEASYCYGDVLSAGGAWLG
ncbi:MAG: SDR family oxidoreductase [Actinomycetota bacterium]|nr:SDR family oxidoreductase [Actinomycetota bacterium]